VPHPRHDTFINDPTHVRPITPEVLSLFSKRQNLRWKETGAANSPLALYHGVDFEVVSEEYFLDEPYSSDLQQGRLEQDELKALLRKHNNVASEISITLQAVNS
jgi:hypothetical protein